MDPRPDRLVPGPARPLPRAAHLARSLGAGASALRAWLADLEDALPRLEAGWLRPDGSVVCPAGRTSPREVDWGALPAPGTWTRRTGEQAARSARAAARRGVDEVLAAPPGGDGVLRLVVPQACALEPAAVVDAARLAAALARSAEARPTTRGPAAELAHDLRNQLTVALFELERLRAEPSLVESTLERVDALEGVLADARTLCASGLGDADRPPSAARVRLRSLLVEQARRAPAMARAARSVRVRVRCAASLETRADPAELARLVQNLVVNALEASHDGGEVRVEALASTEGRVVLVVEDDGRGMSREDLERHFGDAAGSRSRDGTGLGTASAARAVAGLALAATVESAPGAGTRVRVVLPGALAEDSAVVALVDADPARRGRRRRALERRGAVVWDTDSPARALAWLRAVPCEELVVARGTRAADVEPLVRRAERLGVPLRVLGAGEGEAD